MSGYGGKGDPVRIVMFSAKKYDHEAFDRANKAFGHSISYLEHRLTPESAPLASGFPVVCAFANDTVNDAVLNILGRNGTKLLALRSAGFNNVDLASASRNGITVVRVPAYSPFSVAEHTIALILALNRKIHRASNRVREGNFSLDGLMGFDLAGKTAGVVGTGRIGAVVARILCGFGCKVLAYDPVESEDCRKLGVRYVTLAELSAASDVITLHCPLHGKTYHLISEEIISSMKDGVMLINTGRGALIDTAAIVRALKQEKIGYLGLDVYEEEEGVFFEDLSNCVIQDDTLARLLTFPNVLITSHQGFFTREALQNIAETTLKNVTQFDLTGHSENEIQ